MMNTHRLKLGILLNFSTQWMGGIIYIINLIKTLNFLDERDKPEILLFYNADLKKYLNEINYPYIKTIEWEFPSIMKGSIKSWILRKNVFIEDILKGFELDAVYPLQDYPVKTKTNVKLVSWCADFQHRHYPEYFSRFQIMGRNLRTKFALKNNDDLVLSSNDAFKDLTHYFKVRSNVNVYIYHFVSVIEKQNCPEIKDLRTKYNLPEEYYVVSNQFHKHKNHRILFLALAKLKEQGIRPYIALTGKLPQSSESPYLKDIHAILEKNKLYDQINLLGIISREDQLQIMKHSKAVIQPSLFEGWSTVIEDAISLQVPVIASSLNVNIEQLGPDGNYFDPHDPDQLATILKNFKDRDLNQTYYENYEKRVREAAYILLRIFQVNKTK